MTHSNDFIQPELDILDYVSKDALNHSYDYCYRVMKNRAVSFFQAFSKLQSDDFQAVQAIYVFCRYCDDLVDQPDIKQTSQEALSPSNHASSSLDHLEAFIHELFDILDQNNVERFEAFLEKYQYFEWLYAFVDTICNYGNRKVPFLEQISGQRMDLSFEGINSFDELILYCKRVAGSVGGMLLPILSENIPSHEFLEASYDLGIGMQLTNILRDIGEDIRERNRVYIPKLIMEDFDVTSQDFQKLAYGKQDIPEKIKQLWEIVASESQKRYESFFPYLKYFKEESQFPLLSAALVYQSIEDEVRKNDYQCFHKRCYTSAINRMQLIVKAKKMTLEMRQNDNL